MKSRRLLVCALSCLGLLAGGAGTARAADPLSVTVTAPPSFTFATNPSVAKCTEGEHFSLTATFHTQVTANARYDAAFFFRTDGGVSARGDLNPATNTGTCSLSQLNRNIPPALNLDGDACGDLNSGAYDFVFTIPDVVCKKAPNTNPPILILPNCTSWHSNQGTACSLATAADQSGANPDTKSKCVCDDTFTVPVLVETGKLAVTKDVTPGTDSSLPEPGGQFSYTVSAQNTATAVTVTLDRICDDQYGTIQLAAGQTACPAGKLTGVTIDSTDCVLPQVLQPGDSITPVPANSVYSCSFKASLTGSPQTLTDTVTFYGHDQNSSPVTGSDSAQVAITDVPATATVAKSETGLACADVNYHVKVTNTDTGDANITLSALNDSAFGDLTTLSSSILSTTCGTTASGAGTLPATIAKGGLYECDFKAHFCGGTHKNTITASIHDESNTNVDAKSDELTVNVCATTSSTTCPPSP